MCTLSWHYEKGGYSLFFNRDERLARRRAQLPAMRQIDGINIVSPRDTDKGGSWIAVNEMGTTHCLLNLYGLQKPCLPARPISRGLLLLELSTHKEWASTFDHLEFLDLSSYEPFQYWQFTKNEKIKGIKWDGEAVHQLEDSLFCERPISGSSYQNDEVITRREQTFRKTVSPDFVGAERIKALEAFHNSSADPGAFGVNMLREDAQTVSYSKVVINDHKISFHYQDKNQYGLEFAPPVITTLPLRLLAK